MARSTVAVRFTGDVDNLKRSIGDVEGRMKGLGGKGAALGKALAVGLGGAAVAGVALGKSFVDAAIESQKVTKQTEAVLKSMGGAAGLTADDVADLSEKLSMQTGVDDELIQSGQNVLLTFGKVRNEVGKGNDIFNRATKSALDMSVALGTDLQSANIQVGKALNDPLKGITALSRAGVSFTGDQKEMIKELVVTGRSMDAQKIILKELENQFGGSAAAQATAGDKLKVVWGNLQEDLGAKLLPVVEKVAAFLAANLPVAMAQAQAAFDAIRPHIQAVVEFVRTNWPQIQATITSVMESVKVVIQGVLSVVQTIWNNFGNNILELIQRIWPRIRQIIEGVMNVIRGIIQTVTSLIKGDWSGVWNGIKNIFKGVWSAIQGILGGALELIRSQIGIALEIIGSIFKGAWNGLVDFFKKIPGRLAAVGSGMFDFIKNAFKAAVNFIIDAWNGLEFKIPGFDPPGPGPKFGGFTLGLPDIPRLHSGTPYFRPPNGAREGYALLERGEAITAASQNGGNMVIQLVVDGRVLAEAVRRHDRALR